MATQRYSKDPDSTLDYAVDWSAWLGDDTIAESSWTAQGLTIASAPEPSHTDTIATVWLSGGTLGQRYEVTNTIVTTAGRTDERSFIVRIEER